MAKKCLLMIAILVLSGCQALLHPPPATRVSPGSAGIELDLKELLHSGETYRILYSGPVYNPSALLFLPREGPVRLEPTRGWKEVEDQKQLERHADTLDELDAKLWAIVSSGETNLTPGDVCAFIYTPGYASVQRIRDSEKYKILPVEEQFNPRYHDRAFPTPGHGLF
ncbi:MAG: hypothetical protein K9K39_08755 [Desulfohalobiaceae bacterium]|nr:hypothetical protein [Desulfohalobiaceae bacterium]